MPVWEEEYWQFASAAWKAITCTCGAHGVHSNVGLSDERLWTLVLIGARGRRSRECGELKDGAARSEAPGHAGAGLGGGRCGAFWEAVREVCSLRRANNAMGATRRPSARQAAKRARPCEALTMLRRPQLLTISLICVKLTAQEVGEADQQDSLNNRYHHDQSFSRSPTETTPIPLLKAGVSNRN